MAERGADLVVRDVAVRAVVVPLRRPLATRVGEFSRWPLLLVDVTTEQGITGRGYLAPYLTAATAGLRTMLADLGAALRCQPVSPAAAYASARGWLGLAGYQGLALAAVAGLDIALGEALARCRALDGEGLAWIEEPLRYDDLAGHARLAADLATPVMLGENFYGPRAMDDAIRARACDLVMPDLMRIGGVTGWLQAAAVADVTGLPMSSHLYPEVSGHLLRVTPTGQWLEWQDWAHPVLARPFEVRSGELHLPEVPGNGLEWDESAVAHYQVSL